MDMQNQNETPPKGSDLGRMSTDKALDAMMAILPDVARILNDPEAEEVSKKFKGDAAKDVEAGDAFQALLPLFARKYRAELYRIVAACQDCTVDEATNQPMAKTIAVFAASLRTMNGFFVCCLHMARNM